MIDIAIVHARSAAADGALPLLTVEEFFDGNTDEESLAPNQWGFGRPPLAEIAARLRTVAAADDVAWVRVQLHEEFLEDYTRLPAESIAVCTRASTADLETRLDTNFLESSGVMEGWSLSPSDYCDQPPIPSGYRVVSITWN